MSKTIKQISDMEGVTKHAIKERMLTIPNFNQYVNKNGVYRGRKCILVNDAGVKILRQKGNTYRAINHGKSNSSKHHKTDSYKIKALKSQHQLEEVKTGRKALQFALKSSRQSLADVRNDRDRWRNVATSAQSQIAANDSKDSEIKKLALRNQANSYEARLRALPSNDSTSSQGSISSNNTQQSQTKKPSFWQRLFGKK